MKQEYAIEYLTKTPEGPYLDRKSSRIEPKDIIKHVIVANSDVLNIWGITIDKIFLRSILRVKY